MYMVRPGIGRNASCTMGDFFYIVAYLLLAAKGDVVH